MGYILGISGSLRNARFGAGSQKLIEEVSSLNSEEELIAYLQEQTKVCTENFLEAGRKDGLPFDEVYRNLKKAKGDRGLSNSEAALAAGLWGAVQEGAEINHCGLSQFFPMNGTSRDLDTLRKLVLAADGFLISGPVYFGDRGSLIQEFMEFLREDPECAEHVRNKVYGGIAVGAKRNGGQETLLIYQMVDMANIGMLVVGNDAGTTSQYGGTAKAGDVGTLYKDEYGINTSVGTGRQVARATQVMQLAPKYALNDPVKISIWVLQDTQDGVGTENIAGLTRELEAEMENVVFEVRNLSQSDIYRCIACDVCPCDVGESEVYRCIIKAKEDLFLQDHEKLLDTDAVLLAAYSPVDRSNVNSVYQRFIERTRYWRRDHYPFSLKLGAPLVISEVGANQNLHIRMLTSLIRHNVVLNHPVIGIEHKGEVLNRDDMLAQLRIFVENAKSVTCGRLASHAKAFSNNRYNPVGYEISYQKSIQDENRPETKEIDVSKERRHKTQQSRIIEM